MASFMAGVARGVRAPFVNLRKKGSVEIAQDMFVKTLPGVFAVPERKGKLEKIKKIFEYLRLIRRHRR